MEKNYLCYPARTGEIQGCSYKMEEDGKIHQGKEKGRIPS